MIYRPWGNVHSILPKFGNVCDWVFWGCLGTEDRTIAAFHEVNKYSQNIKKYYFTKINDPPGQSQEVINEKTAIKKTHESFIKLYKDPIIDTFDLQYSDDQIIYDYINQILNQSSGNILLDISCFPKRYFFPIIKFILKYEKINNFIVLNTMPMQHRDGPLSDNFAEWQTIPFFADMEEVKPKNIALFSVGHMPMASLGPIQDIRSSELQLFFPFPGNLRSYKLAWKSVFDIKDSLGETRNVDLLCVNAIDTSELYDYLVAITNAEDQEKMKTSLIAPYGPKAFSLAMAIFASKYDVPVYYTQPRLYYPDYSIGIEKKGDIASVNAYCIVVKRRKLY
jgi:hypothetical protein